MVLYNVFWCPGIELGQLLGVRKSAMWILGGKRSCEITHRRQQESKTTAPRWCVSPAAHRVCYMCKITKLKQNQFLGCVIFSSGTTTQWFILSGIGSLGKGRKRQGDWMVSPEIWAEQARKQGSKSRILSDSWWVKVLWEQQSLSMKWKTIMGGIFSVQVCFWKCGPFEQL